MNGELSWLASLKRTYIGNATATRDMRVQLRGGRAAIFFTLYLVVMTVVLLLIYSGSLGEDGQYNLAMAQGRLQDFYNQTLLLLAVVISLVAPSMGAFAIVSEKQRRSLDLVFSAPTEPKYYLVGKLISSFRYVWLVLVLSLPFCAVSVTLGGTTWSQLFITFILYSMYGLVCVSFGLLMSSLCSKVLPAIIWTYAALVGYLVVTGGLLSVSSMSGTGALSTINPVFSLNPFCYSYIADQNWPVFGRDIPTWILSILMHLLVVKFVVLSAGSLLAPGNSKEIRSLRIHALIYSAAITFLIAVSVGPYIRSYMGSSYRVGFGSFSAQEGLQIVHGRALFGLLFAVGILVVPYLASFGFNDLRRHRPDGMFNLRQTFSGRPSGHLPFLLLVFLVTFLAYSFGGVSTFVGTSFIPFSGSMARVSAGDFHPLSPYYLMYAFLILSIWLTAYFLGWYSSSRTPILSRGRTFALFFFVLGLILPTAIFAIVSPEDSRTATGIWAINPIAGVICDIQAAKITGIHSVILMCIAVLLMVLTAPRVAKLASHGFESRLKVRDDSSKEIPAL